MLTISSTHQHDRATAETSEVSKVLVCIITNMPQCATAFCMWALTNPQPDTSPNCTTADTG